MTHEFGEILTLEDAPGPGSQEAYQPEWYLQRARQYEAATDLRGQIYYRALMQRYHALVQDRMLLDAPFNAGVAPGYRANPNLQAFAYTRGWGTTISGAKSSLVVGAAAPGGLRVVPSLTERASTVAVRGPPGAAASGVVLLVLGAIVGSALLFGRRR